MAPPQAFLFDVFGTVVNWRHSLAHGLLTLSHSAIASGHATASASAIASRMTYTHWESFAVAWHTHYILFSAGFMPGISAWVDNDAVHLRSLHLLLPQYGLSGLWHGEAELHEVNMLWHRLEGWADSQKGIRELNERCGGRTATLSNGSRPLLEECLGEGQADVPFGRILCSDDFRAYKPAPAVYRAAARLGMGEGKGKAKGEEGKGLEVDDGSPFDYSQVAMVAAHLPDLRAAKAQGLRTVYIPRPLEEALSQKEVEEIRAEGRVVDLWIEEGVAGIEDLVRRLDELQ